MCNADRRKQMAVLLVCITPVVVVADDEHSTFELKHFPFLVAYTCLAVQLAKWFNVILDFNLIIPDNAGSFSSHICAHTAETMRKLQPFSAGDRNNPVNCNFRNFQPAYLNA